MKIDLHLHSPLSKLNGDSIKWPGYKTVGQLIYKNNYELISFTDHNLFDWKLYVNFRNYLESGNIKVLPGIELNIITKRGKIGNILFIFRENLSENELKQISNICKLKLKKNGITHKQSMIVFQDFDLIIIPHVGKSDYLEKRDLQEIEYDAFEVTNLNHPNFKKVLKTLNSSFVAFSDTHIWSKFPQHNKLITNINLNENNFDNLKNELKKNKNYIKETYD